jgi:lysophospholipase L1-like esterase
MLMKLPYTHCAALWATLLAVFSANVHAQDTPAGARIHASKIILVGDSTTQVNSGWGGSFCAYHVTSFAACVNLARGGRSTLSYRAEGSWDLALAEMKTPSFVNTWVLIQFGHNDQPGKPGRSTDLATEFPTNIRHYVEEARAAGAHPILLTPLTRRQFKNGQLQNDLAPWAQAIVKVATELKVPLVDLNAKSAAAVQAMGPVAATDLAQATPANEVLAAAKSGTTIEVSSVTPAPVTPITAANTPAPSMGQLKRTFDYTHLGSKGADFFSKLVTDELAIQVPDLRPLLIP